MAKRLLFFAIVIMLIGIVLPLTAVAALEIQPEEVVNSEISDYTVMFSSEFTDPKLEGIPGPPLGPPSVGPSMLVKKRISLTPFLVPPVPAPESYPSYPTAPGLILPPGSHLYYAWWIYNNGNEPLYNMNLTDSEGLMTVTWGATIMPGQGSFILIPYQTVNALGLHETYATGTATTGSGESISARDDQCYTVALTPVLAIDKSAAESTVEIGDTIHYTIKVWNAGNVNLTNVVLNDPKLGIVNQAIGTLTTSQNAANPVVINANYVVTAADLGSTPVENTATADSTETDPVSDSCSVPVAAITIDKTGPDTITIGQTVNYTITIQNFGSAALTNVVVSDPTLGVDWTVGTLAVGASAQQTFSYIVKPEDIPGPLHNQATVTTSEIAAGPSDSWDSPLGPVLPGKMAGTGVIGKPGTSFMLDVVNWPGATGSQASLLFKDSSQNLNISGKASYISLNPETKEVVLGGKATGNSKVAQFKVYAKDNGFKGDIFQIWLYDDADNLLYAVSGIVSPGQISFSKF